MQFAVGALSDTCFVLKHEIFTQTGIEPTIKQSTRDDSGDHMIEIYNARPKKMSIGLELFIMVDSSLEQ